MTETVLHATLFDLSKGYNALYRDRCIDILAGYGVGLRTLRILRTYWVWIQMPAKAGGHYSSAFQSHPGLTQGDPISPTTFNVVVDAFIRHWVTVVGGPQEIFVQEGLGTSIQSLDALF